MNCFNLDIDIARLILLQRKETLRNFQNKIISEYFKKNNIIYYLKTIHLSKRLICINSI